MHSLRRFSILAFTTLLMFGSIGALAQDSCERRVQKAEAQLQKAVHRHGEHSRQAAKSRRHLEDVRFSCHR